MSFNLADQRAPQRVPGARYALRPEALMEAGILSNPETPTGAFKRARALIEHGLYQDARNMLYPHARTEDPVNRPKIAELLGVCAYHCGGDWEKLLQAALRSYVKSHDKRSSARVLSQLGEGQLSAGRFDDAQKTLRRSAELYRQVNDTAAAAVVDSHRARVHLRAGDLEQALNLVNDALHALDSLGASREEGLVRMVRARILAHKGAGEGSAKELIVAERLLASSGSKKDRLLAPLVRAETLIVLGKGAKAYPGLKRLLLDVVDLEDVHTRAWVHVMLGRAAVEGNLPEARRHLMRAKHLFSGIGAELGVADCDLRLTHVEMKLGFAVHSRLHGLGYHPLDQWKLFAAELKIARAECIADNNPDLARRLLFEGRSFALDTGNHALVREVDSSLRNRKLVAHEDLTPMDDEVTVPTVFGGIATSPGYVPPGGPERYDIDSASTSDRFASESAQKRRAERLLGLRGKTSPGFGLTPPKGTGVRVA